MGRTRGRAHSQPIGGAVRRNSLRHNDCRHRVGHCWACFDRIRARGACRAGRRRLLMGWLFLGLAVLSEVAGTLSLRLAANGRKAWYAVVAVGYLIAFIFLSVTLAHGIGLGVVYGIWTAAGVALTAIACKVFFKETL